MVTFRHLKLTVSKNHLMKYLIDFGTWLLVMYDVSLSLVVLLYMIY